MEGSVLALSDKEDFAPVAGWIVAHDNRHARGLVPASRRRAVVYPHFMLFDGRRIAHYSDFAKHVWRKATPVLEIGEDASLILGLGGGVACDAGPIV